MRAQTLSGCSCHPVPPSRPLVRRRGARAAPRAGAPPRRHGACKATRARCSLPLTRCGPAEPRRAVARQAQAAPGEGCAGRLGRARRGPKTAGAERRPGHRAALSCGRRMQYKAAFPHTTVQSCCCVPLLPSLERSGYGALVVKSSTACKLEHRHLSLTLRSRRCRGAVKGALLPAEAPMHSMHCVARALYVVFSYSGA